MFTKILIAMKLKGIRSLSCQGESCMLLGNFYKVNLFMAMTVLLLSNFFLAFFPFTVSEVHAQEEYTYYGYVPAKMWKFNLTNQNNLSSGYYSLPTSVSSAGLITVVAIKNNTHVWVYSLVNGSLISETTINSMQKHYTVFENGTAFKVVTNKLACVLLLNYGSIPFGNESNMPIPNTFYQDTNGAYIGKEFILIATAGNYVGVQYAIFALENARVTITREDGQHLDYTLDANAWKEMMLEPPLATYKIESTGNIMVQSGRPVNRWANARTFYVPSTEGGFVGTTFYSWANSDWDLNESYGFRVSATQDTTVTVWSLQTKEKILTANVQGGIGWGFKPQAPAIFVQSDHPITLSYFHNGSIFSAVGNEGIYGAYGSGVGYFGVKPNQDTPFYLSIDSFVEAYIFASEDTKITLDGYDWFIEGDSYHLLTQPGTHVIRSNKNMIVETLNWPNTPEYQGLIYDGVQIPCVQTADAVTHVTLTSLGGFPMIYVIIVAAIAIVGVIMTFLFMRSRRSSKHL